MSTLKVNNLQVGQDATASNNFTLYQPSTPDGTVRLGVGNSGSVSDALTVKNNRLGIGTNDPGQALSIAGSSVSLGIYNTGNNHGNVYFYKDGIPKGWLKYRGDDNRLVIGNVTDSINVLTDGNVGIGTINPQSKLQIGSGGVLRLYRSDNNRYGSIYHNDNGFVFESPVAGDNAYVSSTNNNVILQTAGTTKLIVSNTGNVGIGTTNPSYLLDLSGVSNPQIRLNGTVQSGRRGLIFAYNETQYGEIGLNVQTGELRISSGESGQNGYNINLNTNGSTRLTILSDGNVGIGTTNPDTTLHIEREVAQNDNVGILQVESRNENTGSATNASIIIKNKYGYSQLMQWESNGLRLGVRSVANGGTGDLILTAGTDGERLRITQAGNVGIGTTNPNGKFEVITGSGNGGVLIAADGSSIYHSIVVNNNGDLTVGSRNTSADTRITSKRHIYNYARSDERLVYGWLGDYGFFSTDYQYVWRKYSATSVTYTWRDIWYAVYQKSSDFMLPGHAYRFYLFGSNGRHARIYEGVLHVGDIAAYDAGTSGSYVSSIAEIPGPYPGGCSNPFSNISTTGFTYIGGTCGQTAFISIMKLNNKYGIDTVID